MDVRIFVSYRQRSDMRIEVFIQIAKAVVVIVGILFALCMVTKRDEFKED